ncbi:MAG TPA: radical SAM protein [Pseudomonadales bacterium]|nr:radical SAM protein [Pseudomonadales bacterium]
MKIANRNIDVELTNRCNATCDFCPREKTPKQGFMSFEVFQQTVERIKELGSHAQVFLTGLGEPMLHPQFLACVRYGIDQGLAVGIASNGSRLTPELTSGLLDAGLKRMVFSVSDIDADYDRIYGLDFSVTRDNIFEFIRQSRGRCHVQITVVRHEGNENQIEAITAFWEKAGVDLVHVVREENRGGSHEKPFQFLNNKKHWREAVSLLNKKGLTELCSIAFYSVFIGWNGQYYLCCHDWEKTVPMGSIYDLSIEDVDALKVAHVRVQKGICQTCSMNPINELREVLFEVEQGVRGQFAVANKINSLRNGYQKQEDFTRVMHASGTDAACQIIAVAEE